MMAYWTPPLPKRFGQVPFGHGLVFTCVHCGRHQGVSRAGALVRKIEALKPKRTVE